MGLLDRLSTRKPEGSTADARATDAAPVHPTKALKKFLSTLTARECPVLLDLGPVVGNNVNFFGEQLGCKIFVEDIYAEIERHAKQDGGFDALPGFLAKRFPQPDGTVDGILCWDIFDYLPRPAAQVLATQLARVLRPEGALLAFFATLSPPPQQKPSYTKFIVENDASLVYRPTAASRGRQPVLVNRDILRLFEGLTVADSFLLKHNVREILFRKPA